MTSQTSILETTLSKQLLSNSFVLEKKFKCFRFSKQFRLLFIGFSNLFFTTFILLMKYFLNMAPSFTLTEITIFQIIPNNLQSILTIRSIKLSPLL